MPGLTGIGIPTDDITVGWQAAGTVCRTKARLGATLTTITISEAGNCMKATGITTIIAGSMDVTVIITTAN